MYVYIYMDSVFAVVIGLLTVAVSICVAPDDVTVAVTDVDPAETTPSHLPETSYHVCTVVPSTFTGLARCDVTHAHGRYVFIKAAPKTKLKLCDVEVFSFGGCSDKATAASVSDIEMTSLSDWCPGVTFNTSMCRNNTCVSVERRAYTFTHACTNLRARVRYSVHDTFNDVLFKITFKRNVCRNSQLTTRRYTL